MKRRLLNLLTALSVLACVAVAALWVRSDGVRDVVWRERASRGRVEVRRVTVATLRGGLQFESYRFATRLYEDPDLHRLGRAHYRWTVGPARHIPEWSSPGDRAQFVSFLGQTPSAGGSHGWFRGPPPGRVEQSVVAGAHENAVWGATVPFWLVAAVACIVPVYRMGRGAYVGLARRRRGPGLCPVCGYDLTGNVSGVCPECGVPTARG